MDTAISDGVNAHFNVFSHLPNGPAYGSYEANDQCQAPQTQVVNTPPACQTANRDKPLPKDFKPIQANVCLWREEYGAAPDNLDRPPPQQKCWELMEPWIKSGTYLRQPWHESSVYVLSRVIKLDNQADLDALDRVLAQCDDLYGKAGLTAELGTVLHPAFCDASGTLYDHLIEPTVPAVVNEPGAGPAGNPDSCD